MLLLHIVGSTRIKKIFEVIRDKSDCIQTRNPRFMDDCDDFLPLPPDDAEELGDSYIIDKQGQHPSTVNQSIDCRSFTCPETIEEMLLIVRELQKQVDRALPKFRFQDPRTSYSSGIETAGNNEEPTASTSSSSRMDDRKNFSKKFF